MQPHPLLFRPSITRWAVIVAACSNIAGLCTALGSASGAINGVFHDRGPAIAGGLIMAGIVCTQIAGWGRSTLPAVDNHAV